MTKNLVAVQEDDYLTKAEEIFMEFSFHHILVMKGGNLSGIVSSTDLVKAYRHNGTPLKIKDIMTKSPLTLQADDSIGLAADIFLANKLHALPIMENNDLVGMVTSHDLLKYVTS
jgi:CBS domain-containing protein